MQRGKKHKIHYSYTLLLLLFNILLMYHEQFADNMTTVLWILFIKHSF